MAYDTEPSRDQAYVDQADARRDAAALLMLVVGMGGLIACAFVKDTLLGWTVCSVLVTVAGVVTGLRRML